MRILPQFLAAAVAWALSQTAVSAAALTIGTVTTPSIYCIYQTTCSISPANTTDTVGNLIFGPLGTGAVLQSRTIIGGAGSPAAGKIGYLYRLDLTAAAGNTDCVAGMVIGFGPIERLNYTLSGPTDLFLINPGGFGTVEIGSANYNVDGQSVEVYFSPSLCAGKSAMFFGLTSTARPGNSTVEIFAIGSPPIMLIPARVP